jgi:DmsE family decaheme c-type cytochrome
MWIKSKLTGGFAALLVLAPLGLWAADQTPPAPEPAATPAAETAVTQSCGDCHDQAKAFETNVHAFGAAKKGALSNDVCTTCHGDGAEHIANGGDKTKITVPRGLTGANETCMMCHQKTTDKVSRRGGMHANSATVNCLSCHSVHSAKSDHLVVSAQLGLCGTCHTQAASFRNKPFAHKLDRGTMECTTCHDPHGRPGKDSIRTTSSGEIACLGCHTDKRGPFVFKHGAVAAGECATCHEPHGSMNAKQLARSNVQQLCLECHSTIGAVATFGSQPPSFHNLSTARYQNCTTCHAAIHGSNRDPQLLK